MSSKVVMVRKIEAEAKKYYVPWVSAILNIYLPFSVDAN